MRDNDLIFDPAQKRRWFAAGLALALACGLGVTTPLPAQAAPGDIVIKSPNSSAPLDIVVASGSSQLLRKSYDRAEADDTYELSTDGGASWRATGVRGWIGGNPIHVKKGVVTYHADSRTVSQFDLSSNTSKVLREIPYPADVIGEAAVLFEGWSGRLEWASLSNNNEPLPLNFTPPRLASYSWDELAVGPDSAFVATIGRTDADLWVDGYLSRAPFSGAASTSVKVPGLAAIAARGEQAVYITGTKSGASICFRSPTPTGSWGDASCATLKTGDQRRIKPSIEVGDDWIVVRLASNDAETDQFVVRGQATPTPALVKPPKGVDRLRVYGVGDSTGPLADVIAPAGSYHAYYRPNGSLDRIADYEVIQAAPFRYALTPGAVLATAARPTTDTPGLMVWSRSIANGAAGAEQILPVRASAWAPQASGDRVIINGITGTHLLERGAIVRKLPATTAEVSKLTGAYYMTGRPGRDHEMRRIDGTRMLAGSAIDIFGSLALKQVKKNTYQVVDVTGASKPVNVSAPSGSSDFRYARLWGDWIAYWDQKTHETVIFNYRATGQSYRHAGQLVTLGDGFALTRPNNEENENALAVWDFAKNTTRAIASNDGRNAVTDGSHRMAFETKDGDLVVRELSEGGRSKPRLLGLIAPTTLNNTPSTAAWKPEIDATKALGKGTLSIKNSKGKTVHTIAVKAAPNGSIRDIAWNGRTTSGARVPAGAYTWELTAPAVDGTGNLVRVDGTSALKNATGISGTIKVTSKSLGTVKGSTPKISDTTPVVGQTLIVKPGTWKPAGVTLSYTWYRDKKKISGATRTTYTVTTGDVGKKLTVKVTGTRDGWKTTTKTSKATSKIKRK